MRKKLVLAIAFVVAVAMMFTACAGTAPSGDNNTNNNTTNNNTNNNTAPASKYPERSINLIVPFGAGGGTDTWNRALAAALEGPLGVKVLVNNMTGGGPGGTGTNYVWTAPHDGYTIAGTSETPLLIPVMTTDMDQTAKDWEYFIAGGSPGLLLVNKNSGYKDFQSLIDASKANPGSIKIASTNGGLWFILANLLNSYGEVPLGNATYDGSRPAITACVSGETVAVAASAGEVADFIKSGDLVPVANFDTSDYDFPGFGTIPAVTKLAPKVEAYLPLKQFIGFMVPVDTPADVKAKLTEAFSAAMTSDSIKKFAEEQYAVIYNLTGDEAKNLCSKAQSTMSWMLSDMGMTQRSPEAVGIPKP